MSAAQNPKKLKTLNVGASPTIRVTRVALATDYGDAAAAGDNGADPTISALE
jgi:hypothetical protein